MGYSVFGAWLYRMGWAPRKARPFGDSIGRAEGGDGGMGGAHQAEGPARAGPNRRSGLKIPASGDGPVMAAVCSGQGGHHDVPL